MEAKSQSFLPPPDNRTKRSEWKRQSRISENKQWNYQRQASCLLLFGCALRVVAKEPIGV
jgi:hypothetical protein